MDLLGIAAIITAAGGVLFGLGSGIKYIVSLILTAYKEQAAATVAAKDRDLSAKDATIADQKQEIHRLQTEVITRLTDLHARLSDRGAQ